MLKRNSLYKSRINVVRRINNSEVEKMPGEDFCRGSHKFSPKKLIQRELIFLETLNSIHFPKITRKLDQGFCMEFKGEILSQKNRQTL